MKPSQTPLGGNLAEQVLIEEYLIGIAKILNRNYKTVKQEIELFVYENDVKMLDAAKSFYNFYYQAQNVRR